MQAMEAKAPELQASVQCLFPATYQSKDRLILAPSRKEGAPFAQFWIQDDCNVLYHGGISDTRGDLIHYEVDGTMIIADRGAMNGRHGTIRYWFPNRMRSILSVRPREYIPDDGIILPPICELPEGICLQNDTPSIPKNLPMSIMH